MRFASGFLAAIVLMVLVALALPQFRCRQRRRDGAGQGRCGVDPLHPGSLPRSPVAGTGSARWHQAHLAGVRLDPQGRGDLEPTVTEAEYAKMEHP